MTDVILANSYTNTSCAQVFLYTNINSLFQEAAKCQGTSCHSDKLYTVVSDTAQKEALSCAIYSQGGFTSFSFIGTLSDTLLEILRKTGLCQNPKIHDRTSLSFAIYDLLLQKDKSTDFLQLDDSLLQDKNNLFSLASELALELDELFDKIPDTNDNQALSLKEAIKKLYPEFLFMDEAFDRCHEYYDKLVFVGFTYIPTRYLTLLKQTSAKFYILVPSLAFLGDILSPKQKLKQLRDHKKQLDDSFVFQEHPLLENLSFLEKQFYHELSGFEQIYVDEDLDQEPQNALEKLQYSLKSGILENPIEADSTIEVFDAKSLYEECQLTVSCIQELFQQDPSLTQKDIAIIADRNQYPRILNALGVSLKDPVAFSSGDAKNPTWDFLEMILVTDDKEQDQNFFTRCVIHIVESFNILGSKANVDFTYVLQLIQQGHLAGLDPSLRGYKYLSELKASFLRSRFFELEKNHELYEPNFLGEIDENPEDLVEAFDCLENLLEEISKIKTLYVSTPEWIKEVSKLICLPIFKSVPLFDIQRQLFVILADTISFKSKMGCHSFLQLIRHRFKQTFKHTNECSVYDYSSVLAKRYKYLFFLGKASKANQNMNYFVKNLKLTSCRRSVLNNALSGVKIIFQYGIEDNESILSLIKSVILTKQKETAKLGFQNLIIHKCSKKTFFSYEKIEGIEINLQQANYSVDISNLIKFTKDQERFIKRAWLHVTDLKTNLEADIEQKSLLKWFFQNYEKKSMEKLKDQFMDVPYQKYNVGFIRTGLIDKVVQLRHAFVAQSIKIDIEELGQVELVGYVSHADNSKVNYKLNSIIHFLTCKNILGF